MRDITISDTFYQCFSTRAFATGVPTTLAGTPVVSAYENDSLVQITAGITLTVDFDGVAGLHLLTVVATGANGYEAGKDYALVITTGTVGGVSVVGEVVGEFTIERSAAAVDLDNGTDGLTAIKADTAAILVDTGTTLDGRIPAALVAGRMDSSVGAMAADTITAAAVAVGAIAADAFVAGAIDNAAFNVTETLTANPAAAGIAAASFAAGAIDNAAFNVTETLTANPEAGGIAAASFAAGAIDAAALNADAVDEIWDEAMTELSQAAPSATPAMRALLALLYMNARNAKTVTSTSKTYSNDAGTVVYKSALTDDGTTYAEAELVTGP